MKTIITLSMFLFINWTISAQDFNRAKLDSLFETIDRNDKGMGSISIFRNGEEIYSNTIGFADVNSRKKAGPETKYRIGSVSKTFTAAVVMQLIEEKKLNLNTKLFQFFPEVPNSEKISIENLLRHQSGLVNFSQAEDFKEWKGTEQSRTQMLNRIRENGFTFQPGEKSEYSNTNYLLLSYVIENIEKKDFAEVIKSRITGPLKLQNTYYGGVLNSAAGEAISYNKTGNWTPVEQTHMSIVKGAGALSSTPSDLNRFLSALFSGKVVKPSGLEKMKELKGDFGIGLVALPLDEKVFYGHTGGIDGFNSVVAYLPEEGISIAFTSNARDMAPPAILLGAAKIFFGKEYEIPTFKSFEVAAEDFVQYEGIYSGENFPLKLKIFTQEGQLMGQAEGQPSFPLEAYEKNKFKFDRLGVKLEFIPAQNKMIFKQGPNLHELSRA